ncbi:hypothetical protein LAZ67_X001851 [Cordylochernes scorpioides]|uniref:Integrase catalytic domain-containing protein n=1 Tax=Cordylochernes scorpioides TaxID=51811 RepID=A0ABY6LSV1_9ARAC|nr:hypothetical protein LAZ67_X001851 [Cordylochernes scorpioides]
MLTEFYVRKLLKLVIASARSEKRTLAQLYDDLVAHLHSLGSLGVDTKSGGGAFLYPLMESSLPLELIKIWQRSRTPFKERDYSEIEAGIEHSGAKAFDKLEGLIEFLKQEVKNAERLSFVAKGFEPSLPLKQGKRENNPPKIHTASALFVGKTNLPCLFCDKDKLCCWERPHFEIMCRGTSHRQENLNWRSDNRSRNSLAEQNEGKNEPVTAMANQVCTNNISLMTLIVKIKGPKRSKMVRVLLDSGSQKSYIRRSLAKELDLPKAGEVKLNKFLFGGQTTGEKAHSIFYFQLDNVDERKAFKMEALEETIICGDISPVETGPRQWELDKKGITLTKVDNNKTEIDILIGGDYYGQLLTGQIEQLAGELIAIQTVLGWTLIGNTSSERPETSAQMVITLLTTQQRVTSLWELETIGIRDPTEVISEKEKNVLMQEKFREKICRGHDGRYLVLKLAKYKSLDITEKFKITYNAVKEIDSMLVSINRLLDGIKQDKSTSEEFSIKLPKFQLPIFSGNFSEWLGFKEIFIKVIDQNRALANSQKLQYLVSALRGDAARLVRAFSISDENYSIAWQTLIHRSNHFVYACKLTAVCGVCKLKHHTLLHAFSSESHDSNSLPGPIHAVESSNANRVDSSGRSNVNSSARLNSVIQTHSINHSSSSSQILLSTALIRVNDLYGNSCMARALVDTGSQRTLITDSLRKTLNLPVNYSDASMLADPTFDKPAPIDIIIGADIAPSLYTGQVRFQNERGPTACNSKLGWLLSGKIMAQQSDGSLNHSVLTFCATSIDNQLRKFWELDSIPPCTQPILTKEEMDCEQHFKTNVLRTSTGRYQVRLPFRVTPNFGNSRRVAFKRFLSLENKLLKSEQLYSRYKLFMKEYSSLNHMQIISAVDIPKSPSQVYYMPHHCVLKEESTTTNLRVFFDASACSDDSPSLNKALHLGPKLQTDIFDLLLRFRTFFVALSADIEKMYRQILIHPDDTCAPYLAIRTLHQLADDEAMNYPVASEIVKRDFYVDDLLTGADTVEEAHVLIRQIIALLAEGGFPIRKWVSNSPKILEFLPKYQKGINLSFDIKDLPSVKLLGILWDPTLDSFTIRVRPPDIQVYSKRSLLSLIARIYDPLGWMAPLVIIFKIMLQKLWAKGCNWDERLPECIQRQWTGIEGDINQLNIISIPRYIPCRNSILTLELHGFCDSSEKAYAAVIYVKSCKHDGSIDISLIASKTKVAPIKALSLPRLELCSALLLANLFVAVKESLSLHFDQIFLWSDSTIALNWIKSESKRWKTFVANRVSTIQRKTPPHSWFHVPGSENPADLATRGLTPAQLDPSVKSCVDLPPSDELSPETLIEERSTILVYHSIMGPMPELLLKYSSWIRTVDVMAFCLRFISNCKSTNKSLNRFLSASEIHNATVKIIILIQNQDFIQDIGWLRDKGFVSGKSNLRFLNPFLDADGILRVGGRLQHSNLDSNRKHPIILPKRHHCTDLIIEHYHKQSTFGSTNHIIYDFSEHRSKTVTQIMGELPLERVVPSRPFQRVGVDLAGPIITKPMLKRSKILFKTYIVLFICFTTKAIHLEVVSDLTAEAFIATLRRFTSRRGLPSDIFSDNATNFKLANRVLLDFYRELDIQNFCAQKGIRWHFIPPSRDYNGVFPLHVGPQISCEWNEPEKIGTEIWQTNRDRSGKIYSGIYRDQELMPGGRKIRRSRRTKLRGVLQASYCFKRSDCCLPPTPVYFLEDSRRFYELMSPVLLMLPLTVPQLVSFGDFELDNEPRGKPHQKFEDAEQQALLDEDSAQTQEKLAKQLQVSQGAVSLRLNSLRMTQKLSRWVPHDNPTRQKSWVLPGQFPKQTPRPNRFGKKAMLCVWGDQTSVVYFELLKPGETVDTSRYKQQIHSLRESLNEKRPEWREKHNKLILQHDNAPAHNATVVKNTIKYLG